MSARTEKKIFLKIRKTRHFYQKIPGPLPVTFPSSRRGENIPNNEPKKFEINCTKIEWKLFPTHLESHILPSPLRKTLFYGKSTTFPYATCFSWFGFCEPIYFFYFFLYLFSSSWVMYTMKVELSWHRKKKLWIAILMAYFWWNYIDCTKSKKIDGIINIRYVFINRLFSLHFIMLLLTIFFRQSGK